MTLRKSAILVVMLLVLPLIANADFKLVQVVHVDGYTVQGQNMPAKTDTSVTWLGSGQARIDVDDTTSFVILADKDMMYKLDHIDKKYTEMPVGGLASVIKAQGDKDSTAMAQAKMMLDMFRIKAKVTPSEETQKIGSWNCKKYEMVIEIAGTPTTTEMWVTEDIELDYDLYHWAAHNMKALLPGFDDVLKEMKKIKGIQVKSTTNAKFMGGIDMKTTTDLISADKTTAPAGSFSIPEGYKQTDLKMPGM